MIDNPTPEQIARLPKWAQEYIGRTESKLAQSERELSELKGGTLENPDQQKFYVERYGGEPFWLPQYGTLKFSENPTADNPRADFQFRESDSDLGGVKIMSSARGRLVVTPTASNVIEVTTIDY